MRVKKITIYIRKDVFIVEKINCDRTVPVETRFFCGCCGEIIGTNQIELTFPFHVKDLISSLGQTCTIQRDYYGVKHRTCGHTINNVMSGGFSFVNLETYFRDTKKSKNCQKPVK